jgi:hypothetical protein
MPYNRPGPGVYVTNGGTAIQHGTPQVNSGFAGVAVKQKTRAWSDAYSIQATIDAGENYYLITKGMVQVGNQDAGVAAAAKGTPLYIVAATGVLTVTGPAGGKFGRIAAIAGERGTPTGKIRVDLDSKDSFV